MSPVRAREIAKRYEVLRAVYRITEVVDGSVMKTKHLGDKWMDDDSYTAQQEAAGILFDLPGQEIFLGPPLSVPLVSITIRVKR